MDSGVGRGGGREGFSEIKSTTRGNSWSTFPTQKSSVAVSVHLPLSPPCPPTQALTENP